MPTKFLKPKNMRRGLLALLLAAPLVYMFGSLFFALNGAHEGMDINQECSIVERTTNIGTLSNLQINNATGEEISGNVNHIITTFIDVKGAKQVKVNTASIAYFYDEDKNYIGYISNPQTPINLIDSYVYMRISMNNGNATTYYTLFISVPVSNNDYLFGQFFAKDNWVSSLGEKAVNNDTGIGLPFVGDLISYIDENAMPLSNSAYGYFIWGYSSYILNVLSVYMVVSIAASLVLIPMKVVDSLEERING